MYTKVRSSKLSISSLCTVLKTPRSTLRLSNMLGICPFLSAAVRARIFTTITYIAPRLRENTNTGHCQKVLPTPLTSDLFRPQRRLRR